MSLEKSHLAICRYRWEQAVIQFNRAEVRTCCRTYPPIHITQEDLEQHGANTFLNHPLILERREGMLRGERHADCKECWYMEDSQQKSFRKNEDLHSTQQILEYFRKVSNSELSSTDEAQTIKNLSYSYRPKSLVLFLSNHCDLKCAYCYYGLSTSWASENVQFDELDPIQAEDMKLKVPDRFEAEFWNWFESVGDSLSHIGFTGGEPTLAPKFKFFVEKIISYLESKNRQVFFSINTNLNYNIDRQQKNFDLFRLIANKHNFEIDVSVDSLTEQGEYIRSGLNNKSWILNFEALLQLSSNIKIGISPTLNVLIGTHLKDLLEKILRYQLEVKRPIFLRQNIVSKPERLSAYILRPEDMQPFKDAKDLVQRAVQDLREAGLDQAADNWAEYASFLDGYINTILNRTNDDSFNFARIDLIQFLDKNDKKRKTKSFLDVFPELSSFFTYCKSL